MKKLYYGDNLEVLRRYIKDDSIDLCYIDPPFNSKRNYNQIYNNIGSDDKAQAQAFIDTWTWDDEAIKGFEQITTNYNGVFTKQSIELIIGLEKVLGKSDLLAYLISMTLRIAEIFRVLKPTGSFYFHCDPTKGGDFINEIVWCYKSRHFSKTHFGRKHDVIFFYSKSGIYTFNWSSILRPLSPVTIKKFKHKDKIGFYRLCGRGIKGSPIQSAKDVNPKWEITNPELVVRDYLKDGVPIEDYWDIGIINQSAKERLGYPTQKPEALLERIIKASSNEGDLILDAYCGCGTTVAVAERLNRNWIGVDITYQSISLILKRLEDSFGKSVLNDIEINGIPEDFESAVALAHKKDDKTRKEFEKWAVLTYSNNRAMINEKKGADAGIDGIAYMLDRNENNDTELKQVLFSVKSDKAPHVSYIRDLHGTIEREQAAIGYFITLFPPTRGMIAECKKIGKYKNSLVEQEYPKIEIVTVEDILNGKRITIPTSQQIAVVKSAEKKQDDSDQMKLEMQ